MMAVINCVVVEHNPWLVLLAAAMCVAGSAVSLSLFRRALAMTGGQRVGWHFLAAVAAGSSIWSTHFIAMLGYEAGAPVSFDPLLTVISLVVAMVGTFIGMNVASAGNARVFSAVGGAIVGLAISTMHYSGMFAYRVVGLVEWDPSYVIASIVLSVLLSALCFHVVRLHFFRSGAHFLAVGLFVTAIVSLHFTAMAAFRVTPLAENMMVTDAAAVQALAVSIAVVALIIVGAGLSSYLIDSKMRSDSYEQLHQMAMHDPLTGLPNRANFNGFLEQEVNLASKVESHVAVVGIDLNRFKEINDIWGHSAGDDALRILASRLRALVGDGEYVARIGGDEFVAVKRFSEKPDLTEFVDRLAGVFNAPIRIRDLETVTGASLGIAIYPDDADDPESLISNADLAMYQAKTDSTHSVCFYDSHMGYVARSRRSLAEDLRHAIEHEGLDVHYQVQTSVVGGDVRGYEALLRWRHADRGNISPSEFIPLAEENGLILSLGEWVLRRACRDAASWRPPYPVAVNVSGAQFADAQLPALVHEILFETGLAPSRLELELTETAVIKDKIRSLHIIRQIKALGVSVALDDFGTGYSSLETLRTFPFDKIKLDRAFIKGIESDRSAKAIIRAVLALGKSLDIPVLAEGVETQNQMSILEGEGCDEVQGFLFGRPIPVTELAAHGGPTVMASRPEQERPKSVASTDKERADPNFIRPIRQIA